VAAAMEKVAVATAAGVAAATAVAPMVAGRIRPSARTEAS